MENHDVVFYRDKEGSFHRLDGPAVYNSVSYKQYFIHGTGPMTLEQFNAHPEVIAYKASGGKSESILDI